MSAVAGKLHSESRERETASGEQTLFEDSYTEEVDRALEELAAVPLRNVSGFGEMVAGRGVKRVEVGILGLER